MSLEIILTLIAVGILMILCEVFIPGGIVGSIGAVVLVIGIIGGFGYDTTLGVGLLFGSLVVGVLGLWLWTKYFPRSPLGKRMILQTDAGQWHGYDDTKQALVGKEGITHTPLRPTGTVIIEGRRVDVVTQGDLIERKTAVRVVEVEGNRVVVARLADRSAQIQEKHP